MSTSLTRNPIAGVILVAGAVGGPYAFFETDAGKTAQQWFGAAEQVVASADPSGGHVDNDPFWGMAGTDPSKNILNPETRAINLQQAPVVNLNEVLRFDATPTWVIGRFPRVSTVLADMRLDGLRVPLVTGTTPADLAGTLTYYFDRYQRLQRVTLHAVSGDPTRFSNEMQQAYKLQKAPSLGGGLYLLKWNGRPASVLHIAPAPVIYADAAYSRFNVFLELNQAGLEYGLSPEANSLVEHGKQTQRW